MVPKVVARVLLSGCYGSSVKLQKQVSDTKHGKVSLNHCLAVEARISKLPYLAHYLGSMELFGIQSGFDTTSD